IHRYRLTNCISNSPHPRPHLHSSLFSSLISSPLLSSLLSLSLSLSHSLSLLLLTMVSGAMTNLPQHQCWVTQSLTLLPAFSQCDDVLNSFCISGLIYGPCAG